jgi:hypothetical protein
MQRRPVQAHCGGPVQLAAKVALIIDLETARTLGLALPVTLLASADEVIE